MTSNLAGSGPALAVALLLSTAGSLEVRAAAGRWTPFGPGDGELTSFTASRNGDFYVTTSSDGLAEIWQRPAGAGSFRWRNAGLGIPEVTALAVHPSDSRRLWAASGRGLQTVYRSTNAGETWQAVAHAVSTTGAAFRVERLWVVPTRTTAVLIAEAASAPRLLLRSADDGASWIPMSGVIGPVAAARDEPGLVYAGAEGSARVLRSTDAGATFRATGAAGTTPGDVLLALHVTTKRRPLVFASFAGRALVRSTDGGAHWQRIAMPGDRPPDGLASDPAAPSTLVASAGPLFFESSLNGRRGSWKPLFTISFLEFPGAIVREIAVSGGDVSFRAGSDLYQFRKTSPSFGPQKIDEKGIEAFSARELHFHSMDPRLLAVLIALPCPTLRCQQTLLSRDGGDHFARLGGPFHPPLWLDVKDLAFDPEHPPRRLEALGGSVRLQPGQGLAPVGVSTVEFGAEGRLLTGGRFGVEVSTDGGATWTTTLPRELGSPEHSPRATREVISMVASPGGRERILARAREGVAGEVTSLALYRSSDNGASWLPGFGGVDDPLDVEWIPGGSDSAYLLADTATGTELRRSDDDGASSHLVHLFTPAAAAVDLAIDPLVPADLYVATAIGVRRSRDGGASWEPTAGGFAPWGGYRRRVTRIWFHPTQPRLLFAAPAAGGLFENQLPN